jgi:hypothetical protein
LQGQGCPECYGNKKLDTNEFVKRAILKHGDKYDYSQVNYSNRRTPVKIVCKEHGEFFQLPGEHLNGHGCPKCYHSNLEDDIRCFLEKNNIKFEEQKTFDGLRLKRDLRFDFYLEEYGVAIECQGEQHYVPVNFGNGNNKNIEESLEKLQNRDRLKNEYCVLHGIKLIKYSIPKNKKYDTTLVTSHKELKKEIFKNKNKRHE